MSGAEGEGPRLGGETWDERFLRFFQTFKDAGGEHKYRARVRRMAEPAPAPEGLPLEFKYVLVKSTMLVIDFSDLLAWEDAETGYVLADLLVEKPEEALEAARQALVELARVEAPDLHARARHLLRVGVRGLPTRIPLRAIGKEHVGKLVSFKGIVTRAKPKSGLVEKAAFVCRKCKHVHYAWPEGFKLAKPRKCERCGEGPVDFDFRLSEVRDWRRLHVQEPPEELPPGNVPVRAVVDVFDDLVDLANPGDEVVVTGIVRGVLRGAETTYYVEAVGLDVAAKEEPVVITPEDERRIREVASRPDVEELIVSSIAPSIKGLEDVKLAIALQLFGGNTVVYPDGLRSRGDIHILLVGDPGTAKSQLLKYAAMLAPRGVYTSGKGATAAGLTATVVKDPETGAYTLEAGALVLADMGLCAIDEIDKMDAKDRVALHEAMEQQTVSIAKAGIVAVLNARTSILAAANPTFGKYDPNRPLSENISLPAPILSRFDLIFVLRDEPSREADGALAAHVRAYRGGAGAAQAPPLDPAFLRKYIAYARANCRPRISEEAGRKLEEFYVEMRQKAARAGSPVPITLRQFEAMLRLAEAHAKMRLSPVADERDAEAAIRLMTAFLRSACVDAETGEIDINIVMAGRPRSQAERMALLWDLLKRMYQENGRQPVRRADFVEAAVEKGFDEAFVEKALQSWYERGLIVEPKLGYVAPIS